MRICFIFTSEKGREYLKKLKRKCDRELSFQGSDADFSEENRNRCRVATTPLLEAVENLSTFANNPEFASIPAQISNEVFISLLDASFSFSFKSGEKRENFASFKWSINERSHFNQCEKLRALNTGVSLCSKFVFCL